MGETRQGNAKTRSQEFQVEFEIGKSLGHKQQQITCHTRNWSKVGISLSNFLQIKIKIKGESLFSQKMPFLATFLVTIKYFIMHGIVYTIM